MPHTGQMFLTNVNGWIWKCATGNFDSGELLLLSVLPLYNIDGSNWAISHEYEISIQSLMWIRTDTRNGMLANSFGQVALKLTIFLYSSHKRLFDWKCSVFFSLFGMVISMPVARIPKIKCIFSHIIFFLNCCALFHRIRCRCSSNNNLATFSAMKLCLTKEFWAFSQWYFFHLCFSLLSRCKSICFDFLYSQTENVIFSLKTYIRLYCLILGWISRMLAIARRRRRAYAQSLKYCNFRVNSNSFWLTRISNMSKLKGKAKSGNSFRWKKNRQNK